MGPAPSTVKKKPEKSNKQMGSTPLRRSERGKNPVDVHASNVKSTEKSGDISKEIAEEGSRDSNGGSKKRKRYDAVEFKARKSPSFQKQMGPTTRSAVKKKPEKSEKIGSTPLRRSERGKNPVGQVVVNDEISLNGPAHETQIVDLMESGKEDQESREVAPAEKIGSTPLRRSERGKNPVDVPALNVKACYKPQQVRVETVPLNQQEQKRENHGSSNEEALQSSGQILEEDIARKERNEIDKFDSEWDEKKKTIVNDFSLEKTLIRNRYGSNSSVRSEKLYLAEKEFADKLNEHERLRQVHFNDLKAKLKADVGQVVVNDEISLNGPAHETQIVDLMESGKEDQESREVAPALFGNPIEAESHHKPMHDMCPVVVLDGVVNLSDSSNDMVSDSHTSEKHMANATVISKPIGEAPAKQDANMVNDVEGADTTVFSESIGDIPAKHDADATVLSEPIGDIPAIEEIASEQQDEVENVVSGDDAMVSSERIGDISAKHDADIDMAPNDYSADMSHAVEDPNKNGSNDISLHADSDQMGIPAANDLTPHIEYADGSHAVEDPNGTRPNHVAPNVRSVELGIPAGNCNQEKAEDTTPSVQQVASPVSDHSMPAIPEIHNDSHLLQQPTEDRIQDQEGQADHTPMVEIEDDNMQNVEAIQVDQIIPEESSLNPHNEPSSVMSANPTITENQAAMLPTSEVLAQTTAAQTQIQRNANFNQVASQMPRRVDPLHIELEQLSSVKEKMIKSYHDCIQKINIDCEKEIAKAIVEIRLKYHNKRQEADATFNSRKKEVESNMYTVVINQVLAATFRQKCQDVSRGCVALQQACQAESMQQLHRFSPSTCLPGQFPGTQQTPPSLPPLIRATTGATPPQQKQPPCQIIHQPSALFLTPLTRHPHTTNLRPANTTPIRPPPNTETCGQSPQSRPLVSSVTRSTAPHMRPLVSREFQTPGPHMRPFASSGIRSSTSPMRPSNPASSSGPPGFGTYHRTLPVQHVTSSVPLTSPSNSQPLNSTSSVQPLPPLPWKRFPVPQPRSESPHASVATSAHSSLLRGPSVPQIGGPQDKLNDNVKTLTCNAARALNILKTPEFPGGGNGAQPPSAHELVYLSDDD
ncbi:P-loop containing nucleoside triphosphate hydrolase [Tanacetum coccineum]